MKNDLYSLSDHEHELVLLLRFKVTFRKQKIFLKNVLVWLGIVLLLY